MTNSISVVLPFYNASSWLASALRSLARQTLPALEIIAIDDGSTDGSDSVISDVSRSEGLPVKIIRNEENMGIIYSLNLGLDVAQGDYIARMDADDICMPNRFARQIEFLNVTGYDICGSWFVEFGHGISRTARWPHSESALRTSMLFQNTLCHPTVMSRREVFDRYRYREDYRLVEDYDLFSRAMGEFRVANVPEALIRYRRHTEQATQTKRDAMELVNERIRGNILCAQGIDASDEEIRLHNMIRAPYSIYHAADLEGIEKWLLKLHERHSQFDSRKVIASQWIRACIRAAPLGARMWNAFRLSPLRQAAGSGISQMIDISILAASHLDYRSAPFTTLRRLGLSA
ncbi:MAG: glycosyltransferase [Rhodanobacter thiooxydans]|nr:glycosyltransferase [Rhodanobacter thiooxydans]